ncbi:Lipoyltransferase 1, mitochondrial [Halocaridina rubra]|uniref:Lipoyltransferase 1, mitochondrial n=2 Tax=Halocaridina rubra TaxID=373956 RepID=A0AAN8XL52_HALRR
MDTLLNTQRWDRTCISSGSSPPNSHTYHSATAILVLVSGSAAKLGRSSAYHHCSLLVRADKRQLKLALQGDKTIESKATASLPASVMNLSELNDEISVDQLLNSIGRTYLETPSDDSDASPQQLYQKSNGYTLINPTDDWFPGEE